ncbi:MAG: hypothetical protein ACRD24_09830, partial [Terriglobales bacterium]
ELLGFLQSKRVVLVSDRERGSPSFKTSELFSQESLLRLAREAGASHLLYLTVERPATKWIKLTLQCLDLSGKLLWQEVTDGGGGFSSKGGVQKAIDKMKKRVEGRLGGPGLAVEKEEPSTAAPDDGPRKEP